MIVILLRAWELVAYGDAGQHHALLQHLDPEPVSDR